MFLSLSCCCGVDVVELQSKLSPEVQKKYWDYLGSHLQFSGPVAKSEARETIFNGTEVDTGASVIVEKGSLAVPTPALSVG